MLDKVEIPDKTRQMKVAQIIVNRGLHSNELQVDLVVDSDL